MVARLIDGKLRSTPVVSRENAGRTGAGDRPKKSFHCPTKIMTAMPAVKPAITGFGMYLMTTPSFAKPKAMRIIPAMSVAICRPAMPCCAVMMDRTAMKAPVGPGDLYPRTAEQRRPGLPPRWRCRVPAPGARRSRSRTPWPAAGPRPRPRCPPVYYWGSVSASISRPPWLRAGQSCWISLGSAKERRVSSSLFASSSRMKDFIRNRLGVLWSSLAWRAGRSVDPGGRCRSCRRSPSGAGARVLR